MARSAYSVHGISVLVEYPHLLTAPLRRASHETWLQQERGTFNWFHFTTATPTQENGADVLLNGFGLNGVLDGAQLDQIHLRHGGSLVWHKDDDVWALQSGLFVLDYPTGTTFQYASEDERANFEAPGRQGYCLSARVTFTTAPSRIKFSHATFEYRSVD